MAFLFGPGTTKPVSIRVNPGICGEDVLLNDDISTSLATSPGQRVAISVTSSTLVHQAKRDSSSFGSLICWTKPSPDIPGLSIPEQWSELYPELFGSILSNAGSTQINSHEIVAIRPVPLSEIVLVAASQDSYDISQEKPEILQSRLCTDLRIFRQGSIITLPRTREDFRVNDVSPVPNGQEQKSEYRYQVLMTEPVLQGYASPDTTRFIVLPDLGDHSPPPYSFGDEPVSPYDSETSSGPLSDSDAGALEIDENFLASSISGAVPQYRDYNFVNGDLADGLTDHVKLNARPLESPKHPKSSPPKFLAETLNSPPPPMTDQGDPECSIYLRAADLGRIGIFNGDWGVVESTESSRLARIINLEEEALISSLHTLGSPTLMYNILANVPHGMEHFISIRPSFFGSRDPPIPTARAVTIARVSSPVSNDRVYQPLFLRALKEYFNNNKRLVKKGDVISVGIPAELARFIGERGSEDSRETEDDDSDDLMSCGLSLSPKVPNTAVFFKITNLEYDVVDTAQNTVFTDHYVAATMGELGCWIDPQITKMVQTGLEHSRVPDVSIYLRLAASCPILPSPDSSLVAGDQPFTKIRELVNATLYPSAVDYELHLSILLKGPRGVGKFTVASWVAQSLGLHMYEVNCFDVVGENDTQTEGTLLARFERAASCAPCLFVLRHIDALARTTQVLETGKEPSISNVLQECIHDLSRNWKLTGHPVVVLGTCTDTDRIPASVLACFKHIVTFEAPSEFQRLDILSQLLADARCSPDVSIKAVATQTAAMVAGDLVNLVAIAHSNSLRRAMHSTGGQMIDERDVAAAGVTLTGNDLESALAKARLSYSESIGAPKIPNVTWDDVGGLADVKSDILDTIQLPLDHPELFADGLKKRSGILLYGPPGTGKTLLAKAVATSCSLNFFSVKGPELLNMYIGESEANVRRVFQRARDAKPCVIFFDELDSVAPKRGNHGDSGGVMDRIVSQLLAELDGIADGKSGADVFVIGATNRPDLLDPALLRPGRFDKMLYLGVCDNHEAQLKVLEALTRKFRLDPELHLVEIASQCPFNYTGADFYALCSDAMLKAMSRKAEEIEIKIAEINRQPPPYKHPFPLTPQYYLAELATKQEVEVLVSRTDFEDALRQLVPSVSQREMAHYAAVQQRFANDTINAKRTNGAIHFGDELQIMEESPKVKVDKGKGKMVQ